MTPQSVVVAVACCAAPELAPLALEAMGAAGAISAGAATTVTAAVLAAIGDAAVQGTAIGLGMQSKFSVAEMLETSVTAGVGAGTEGAGLISKLIATGTSNVTTQLVEMKAGLKDKFDANGLALQMSSMIAANYIGKGITSAMGEGVTSTTANYTANVATNAVFGHVVVGADIKMAAAQAIGSTVGDNIGQAAGNKVASTIHSANNPSTAGAKPAATTTKQQAKAKKAAKNESSHDKVEGKAKAPKVKDVEESINAKTSNTQNKNDTSTYKNSYTKIASSLFKETAVDTLVSMTTGGLPINEVIKETMSNADNIYMATHATGAAKQTAIRNLEIEGALTAVSFLPAGKAVSSLTKFGLTAGKTVARGGEVAEEAYQLNRFHKAAMELPKEAQQNIRVLRNWAKSKNWFKLPNLEGGPEKWGVYVNGEFRTRLIIKPEASLREGLAPGSNIPRFDAKIKDGLYINLFTGKTGSYKNFSHISLENPYQQAPEFNLKKVLN